MQENWRLSCPLQFKTEQIHTYSELGRARKALHNTRAIQCRCFIVQETFNICCVYKGTCVSCSFIIAVILEIIIVFLSKNVNRFSGLEH